MRAKGRDSPKEFTVVLRLDPALTIQIEVVAARELLRYVSCEKDAVIQEWIALAASPCGILRDGALESATHKFAEGDARGTCARAGPLFQARRNHYGGPLHNYGYIIA